MPYKLSAYFDYENRRRAGDTVFERISKRWSGRRIFHNWPNHFVRKFAERQGKVIDHVLYDVMQSLRSHHWRGNIRELQNFMERAAIMSSGPNPHVPSKERKRTIRRAEPTAIRTACRSSLTTLARSPCG